MHPSLSPRRLGVALFALVLLVSAVACGLLPGYPPPASAAVAQRGLAYNAAVTTGADILSTPMVAPSTASRAVRITAGVKAGATDSTLIARFSDGTTTIALILNGGDALVAGEAFTCVLALPAGYSLNFRPGTNTTMGILLVEEVTGDVL